MKKTKIEELLKSSEEYFKLVSGREYDPCKGAGYYQARTKEEAYILGRISILEKILNK